VAADIVPGGGEAIGRALSALAAERLHFPATGAARARVCDRLAEIRGGIRAALDLLGELPGGAVSVPLPAASGEAIGCAKRAGGDVWHWLRLDHGQIASVFMYDPAWAHWPEFEAAMAGSQMVDLPLMLAAFGLTSSGVDL
jgi:Ni,Fe-hydrogenase III large subunit